MDMCYALTTGYCWRWQIHDHQGEHGLDGQTEGKCAIKICRVRMDTQRRGALTGQKSKKKVLSVDKRPSWNCNGWWFLNDLPHMYIICQNTSVAAACILSNPAVQESVYPLLPTDRNIDSRPTILLQQNQTSKIKAHHWIPSWPT
jgi:hypothetical protein